MERIARQTARLVDEFFELVCVAAALGAMILWCAWETGALR